MSSIGFETMSDFYIAGGTLRRDAECYVERHADGELFEGLMSGEFCYVLTPRQMGKSSLMVRTAARLREAGVNVVTLDLTAVGQNLTPEQWYVGLLMQIGQRLGLEDELDDYWLSHSRLSPLQRWIDAVREVLLPHAPGKIVVFIDEIDVVRSLPFTTDEFFAGIRQFYNWRAEDLELERLTFCLLGVAAPTDLIRNTRTTPFNIGRRIDLSDFTETEALPLARGLKRETALQNELFRRVLYWTGGHPYLTQRLCQAVASEVGVDDQSALDLLCERLFLSAQARERDNNLIFVRERITRSEVDLAGLLSLYEQVCSRCPVTDDEKDPLVGVLRLSGVTRVRDGLLQVRNRIYERVFDREWIAANMPDAEARRQRAAYRRGLLRATAAATLILLLVSALALLAFTQRNRARRQEEAYRRLLYRAEMNLALKDWEAGNLGRMREILESHLPRSGAEDLRGFEWYYFWRLCHSERFTLQHPGQVVSVAVSPDGKILATGCSDDITRLWDMATGQELRMLSGQSGEGSGAVAAFSPDGSRLATGNTANHVRIWDAAAKQMLRTFEASPTAEKNNRINQIKFSPDGKSLAVVLRDKTLKLWNAATGRKVIEFTGHVDDIYSVAFSPDGKKLATASKDYTVRLWEIASGRELLALRHPKGQGYGVGDVAFSPDGRMIASGSDDSTVRLWDSATGKELFILIGHTNALSAVTFSPDGRTLASGGNDHVIKLWNVSTGHELAVLQGHTESIFDLGFSPDGRWLASGSVDRSAKLWDLTAVQGALTLKGHIGRALAVAFSPDGRTLATGGDDSTVRLWDPATGQELAALAGHTGEIWSVAFSPDGKQLASGSYDQTVKLWDVATRKEMATLKGHMNYVLSVAFSPDGKTLASGSQDETAKLWDLATRRELFTLRGHAIGAERGVRAVAFSPDGKRLATCSRDTTIKLWDATTGRELNTLRGHFDYVRTVIFSPDGKRLASAGYDGLIKIWNAMTGRELMTLKGHGAWIYSVTFSPDGRRLASGSYDQTVKLWEADTGQELATLKGQTSYVYSVAFSPDGKTLASASADGAVKLWRAAMEQEVLSRRQ